MQDIFYLRSRKLPSPLCTILTNLIIFQQRWNTAAARSAQKWSEQCRFLTHDTIEGRWVDKFGSCGQNIFVSTHKVPWYVKQKLCK